MGGKASFIGMYLRGSGFCISEFCIWGSTLLKNGYDKRVIQMVEIWGEGIIHRDAFAREVMLLEGGRQLDPSLFFLDICVGPYI